MKQIVCSVLCVAGLGLMGAELRVGGIDFAEVDGTSRLPLEFMRTGENKDKLEPMKLSRFWIIILVKGKKTYLSDENGERLAQRGTMSGLLPKARSSEKPSQ